MTIPNILVDMRILNAEFVKSIVAYEGANNDGLPEVCFIGRSNVGKSSMINSLVVERLREQARLPEQQGSLIFLRFIMNQKGREIMLFFPISPDLVIQRYQRQILKTGKAMIEEYILKNKQDKTNRMDF